MSRSSAGNYTLPLPPVNPGDVVDADWANETLADVAQALTDSLDRYGRGGMLAPFKFLDGDVSAPSITFTNEPSTGFYRDAAGIVALALQGAQAWKVTSSGVYAKEFFATTTTPSSGTSLVNKDYVTTALAPYQLSASAWNTSNFTPSTKQDVASAWNTSNFNPANYAALNSSPTFSTVTASALNVTNTRNFNSSRSLFFIATPSP